MSFREYPNPPVHEVILDIQFHDRMSDDLLERTPQVLEGEFDVAERADNMVTTISVGPAGQDARTIRSFGGWIFKDEDPRWVLRTAPEQLTLHLARRGNWPSGPYLGWEAIYDRFMRVVGLLASVYETLSPRRVGLRYLNRVAVPEDSEPSEWFNVSLHAPSFLKETFTFNWSQVWGRVSEHEDLSAKVSLQKIKVEAPAEESGNQGVLLDIDVFNLWIKTAPSFSEVPGWFSRAHAVENKIFEECITDELRSRFE